MEVTRCLWLFQSCSENAHKISCLKMYAKYNLGCTYNLFLGDPEKRLSRENLFLKSRSRFFRPCFPSAVLSSASSFFPLCQLILSVIPAAPGSRSLSENLCFAGLYLVKSGSAALQTWEGPGHAGAQWRSLSSLLPSDEENTCSEKSCRHKVTLDSLALFQIIMESRLGH